MYINSADLPHKLLQVQQPQVEVCLNISAVKNLQDVREDNRAVCTESEVQDDEV